MMLTDSIVAGRCRGLDVRACGVREVMEMSLQSVI